MSKLYFQYVGLAGEVGAFARLARGGGALREAASPNKKLFQWRRSFSLVLPKKVEERYRQTINSRRLSPG